jgi:hypothetical protein
MNIRACGLSLSQQRAFASAVAAAAEKKKTSTTHGGSPLPHPLFIYIASHLKGFIYFYYYSFFPSVLFFFLCL